MNIYPSLIAYALTEIDAIIKILTPYVDGFHIDIADDQFVSNRALPIKAVHATKKITQLPLQIHLMVSTPSVYLPYLPVDAHDTIIIHCEINYALEPIMHAIRACPAQVGLALNPSTDAKNIIPYIPLIDSIVVMGVQPGASGRPFITETIKTVADAVEIISRQERTMAVIVDGGMNIDTIGQVHKAGATGCVVGSALSHQQNTEALIAYVNRLRMQ